MARYLSVSGQTVTHQGDDILARVGRISGEFGVILDSSVLPRINIIVFSADLIDRMSRKNGLLIYSLGEKRFMAIKGREFLDEYFKIVDIAEKEADLGFMF